MDGSNHSQAGSPARCPAGLLGLLLIVVAVEAGLASIGDRLDGLISADWRHTWKLARSGAARSAEILGFGDSAVKTGMSPEVLRAETGRSCFNLAITGGPTWTSYFLLKRALEAGARPRGIILDAMPHLLVTSEPRAMMTEIAKILGPAEVWSLARAEGDPGMLGPYLAHLVPSVRYRHELRSAASGLLSRAPASQPFVWRDPIRRQLNQNHGAMFLPPSHARDAADPHPGGELGAFESSLAYGDSVPPRPLNSGFLDEFLKLADARSVPVFLLIPPYPPAVGERRDRLGLSERYTRLVRDLRRRHPNLTVVDGRGAGLEHWAFADALHPSAEGAAALSRQVGRVLRGLLDSGDSAGRWVALNGSGGEGEGIPENLTESVLFVLSLTASRR